MKLFHLSDLHLGKRVNEFNMLEDQRYILDRILALAAAEKPDALILAGDIYDKSVPSAEAVELFDDFLYRLVELSVPALVISGNHDSPERIAFGSRMMDARGIYLSPVYDGSVEPVTLTDVFGAVKFWLLPFIKPVHVRRFFPDEPTETYTEAVETAVRHMALDPSERNVLVTHQFVTGAERSESEEISVGGADNVDVSVFEPFDYVALGHIHGPQSVDRETVRYCGTPLKYSFSETDQQKSVTVAELGEKGSVSVRTLPLQPLHDLRELRGTYMELTARENYFGTAREDYIHITLTDEEDVPDAIGKLRVIYPRLMRLDYDNARTRADNRLAGAEEPEKRSPLELFGEFYFQQNNRPLSPEQEQLLRELTEKIWEDRP